MTSKEQAEELASKSAEKIGSHFQESITGWNDEYKFNILETIPLTELLEVAKAANSVVEIKPFSTDWVVGLVHKCDVLNEKLKALRAKGIEL